jgi:hypothetical protein
MGPDDNVNRLMQPLLTVVFPLSALGVCLFLLVIPTLGSGWGCGPRTPWVPDCSAAPVLPTSSEALPTISLFAAGDGFVGTRWVPSPELPSTLHALRISSGTAIVIKADRRLSMAAVKRVIHLSSAAGFSRIVLDAASRGRTPSIAQYLIEH